MRKGLNGDLDRLPLLTWIMFLKFLDDLELEREEAAALGCEPFRPAIEPPYRWRDWAADEAGITGDELLAFINQEQTIRPVGSEGPGLFAYLRGLSSSNGDDRRDVIATVFRGVDNRMKSGYLLRDVVNKLNRIHFTSSEELHTLGALYESMLRGGDQGRKANQVSYTPRALGKPRKTVEAIQSGRPPQEGAVRRAIGRTCRRVLYTLAGAALMATPLAAQVAPDSLPKDSSVTPLDALVVSTTRPIAITGGTSAVLVNPDSLHLAPAPTLEQVLRELPFITVRENSRGQAELSVRGSESRQVAVLLDGIPLTMGWDHRTDPSIIPATGAQSIVLVRGLHSLLYGPNVLGGVVEVNVAHGPAPLQTMGGVQVRAGFNHLGGRTASATGNVPVALASGDLLVRAGAGHRARPGFALPAEVDDPGSNDPALRLNSHLRHTDAFLALRYHDFNGAWMGLSTSAFRAKRGVPPETHVFEPRLWRYPEDSRLLAVLSAGTGQRTTRFGAGDLEASLGVDIGATEVESFESRAYETVVGTESSDDRTLTLRLLGDHTLGSSTSLRGAVTLADISHGEVINGDEPTRYRQRLWSLGTEATRAVWEGTHLSGGIVLDGADTPESGGKPPLERLLAWGGRLGASSLVAGGTVRLHGAVSRRARFPSLRELYSGALGSFVPNPDLQPETLVGMETGATTRRAGIGLQAVLFHHRLSDAVVRASAGNRKFRRENRDEVRSTGLELLADWNGGGVSVTGDLMLQNVRIIDPGVAAGARRPEHMPGFRAGVNLNAPLPLELRGFASAKYIGDQFCIHPDLETTIELDGSPRGDLGVDRSWSLGRGGPFRTLRATLALDNFTDTAIFDQCGLPQPGRTLRFGIEIG